MAEGKRFVIPLGNGDELVLTVTFDEEVKRDGD